MYLIERLELGKPKTRELERGGEGRPTGDLRHYTSHVSRTRTYSKKVSFPPLWEGEPIYNEALYTLYYESKKDGEPHIPTFAQHMLEALTEVGLLHTRDAEPPANIRRVRTGGDQELWIRFDTYRAIEGYMAIDVVDTPRSDAAMLAAMVAWLVAEPIDLRLVAEPIDLNKTPLLKAKQSLEYLMPLIKHYRPEVKDYSSEEFLALVEKACYHINNFLDALRKLQAFLEYGSPNKKLSPSIREPDKDIKAAILHDVDGLNYRQIGEKLKIPPPPDFEIKGEHQTVRKMVERGRNILEQAFGEKAWRERAATMKAEKEWWRSRSREERDREWYVEWLASNLGISLEEAREDVRRHERRRS